MRSEAGDGHHALTCRTPTWPMPARHRRAERDVVPVDKAYHGTRVAQDVLPEEVSMPPASTIDTPGPVMPPVMPPVEPLIELRVRL